MNVFIDPFQQFLFMRDGLLAIAILSLATAPIGCLLVLKRMSLIGDTLSHAILPGVAVAFALFGLNVLALSIGALATGLLGAVVAGIIAPRTNLPQDASFAAFYLVSLAVGVCLISAFGSNADILHFLFGNLLAMPPGYLQILAATVAASMLLFLLWFKPLLASAVDAEYVRMNPRYGNHYESLFLLVFVAVLVAAFFAIGTLLAMGLFLLPAIIVRLWGWHWRRMMIGAVLISWVGGGIGLLLSFYYNLTAGPGIIMVLGVFYAATLLAAWFLPRFLR